MLAYTVQAVTVADFALDILGIFPLLLWMIFLGSLAPVVRVVLGGYAPRRWVRHTMCFRKVNDLQTSQNHEVSENM